MTTDRIPDSWLTYNPEDEDDSDLTDEERDEERMEYEEGRAEFWSNHYDSKVERGDFDSDYY